MQTVLAIAGFDPSSGAGITADLFVFAAHGLFGTSCITSLTVQSTLGVQASYPVESKTIAETLAYLDDDLPPAGIKIGMLATAAAVEAVALYLERIRGRVSDVTVVVDPVLRSSSGRELLDPGGVEALRSRLLPLADWVTPNLAELAILAGQPVADRGEMSSAAFALHEELAASRVSILAKGGHLESPHDLVLLADGTEHWLPGKRIETISTHGTGCALSSALLSRLVLGDKPITAAQNAKDYVTEALRRASPIGHGHGPMNHLWPFHKNSTACS